MPITHRLVADAPGERLDAYLASKFAGLTRSYVKVLIDSGLVTVAERAEKPAFRLKGGEALTLTVPDAQALEAQPEEIPLAIVYEDGDLVVVDKPAGMPVHPGPGHSGATLVNAVLAHCPDLLGIKGTVRPGIVHRLDRDTSGLIIVAKHDAAHLALSEQFKERRVAKTYLALAKGHVEPRTGTIEGNIDRDPGNRKRMAISKAGRSATTNYRVLEYLTGYSFVEVKPTTGRTHQIRVHFSATGHPLIGDNLYGGRSPLLTRQFLHAAALTFQHPMTGVTLALKAPLPADLAGVLRQLDGHLTTIEGRSREGEA